MISVIIPLMPVEPYRTQIDDCLRSLKAQDIKVEPVVMIQKESPYINKNGLLNDGIKEAGCEHIFLCDADFRLTDTTLLRRMKEKDADVVFPMFMSEQYKKLKICDGGVFTTKTIMNRHGKLDESLEGISWVTFPFLKWCLDNVSWHCSDDFVLDVDQSHFSRKKRHSATSSKMRPIYKKVVSQLKAEGVWP